MKTKNRCMVLVAIHPCAEAFVNVLPIFSTTCALNKTRRVGQNQPSNMTILVRRGWLITNVFYLFVLQK